MVEVEADGGVADLSATDACVLEAFAQLAVLAAIGHAFVETVCCQDVEEPARGVVPVPCRARGGEGVQQTLLEAEGGELVVLERPRHAVRLEPRAAEAPAAEDVVSGNSLRRRHRQLMVAATEEASRCTACEVHGHEVAARDAVAVAEKQVARRGLCDGSVQDLAFAEAVVRVPDVADGEGYLALHAFDQASGAVVRPVVGNHHLEAPIRLRLVTPKHFLEPFGLVVGGKDHGQLLPVALRRHIIQGDRQRTLTGEASPEGPSGREHPRRALHLVCSACLGIHFGQQEEHPISAPQSGEVLAATAHRYGAKVHTVDVD